MLSPHPPNPELFEAAPLPLLHVDVDGSVQYINAAARHLWGAAFEVGQPATMLWAEGSDGAGLCGPGVSERELCLAGTPARRVTARCQALTGGGWVLALQPLPDVAAGAAESQLALAVDLGNIAVWRHDLATQRIHCNAQGYQVLGIAPRPEGMLIDEVLALIHPDDLPLVMASAEESLASDTPTDVQARYRRSDGSWRRMMTRRVVQRDTAGRRLAFIGVALDTTTRDEQHHRAEEMTRRFELATHTAGIGYWVLERGADRATWNKPLRAIFGLPDNTPVPRLGEWLRDMVHPDDGQSVRQCLAEWTASGRESLSLPFRVRRSDGSVRHLSTHSRVETGAQAPLLFGVVIDLSERRSAELALRDAEEHVALATRGAGLGTWQLDPQTGEAVWDAQMWLLRGHTPQSRAMTEDERWACVHPEDRVALYNQFDAALACGGPIENEFRVVWPDGQVRWLSSRSVEISEAATGTRRRIGVNWDSTDKRNAEAARREREIALRENQAKSKFLARMSHELRTPLNAVLGFSQLLLAEENGADAASASRLRQLEHIRSAGMHLLELINDVLDLSSLEGGELRIALQPVALAPLVEQTLPLLGTLLDTRRVSVRLGNLQGSVMADATRLRQVLLNLLTNAVKYNREGGQVTLEALPRGTDMLLRVSDTGHGMNDEQLLHLFEPFNRLGRHSEGPGGTEGSGIGLAIVKALVERMGGSVHVDSTPGVGSVFELRLADGTRQPAAPAASALPAQAGAPEAAPAPQRGVLLYIEDNPVNALIISELVARRQDLKLHIAVDGESGVRSALQLQPDLVLLDMQLPDFDGHEVLRRLRLHPQLDQMPVIALSANAMPEDIERALQAGMSDYWTKPLDFAVFTAALDKLFGPAPGVPAVSEFKR